MSQAAVSESYVPTIPLPSNEPREEVEEVGSVRMLLKSPHNFARMVAQDRFDWQPIAVLFATSLGFYSLYGLAMGVFAGGNSLWQAALKAPLVLFGALAFCAPALYVMLSMARIVVSGRQVAAMLAGLSGLSSGIMLCFAPITCLFGASTSSLGFMIGLHIVVWTIALCCGLGLMAQVVPGGFRECKVLLAWSTLFLVVSAQMLTYCRPILGVAVNKQFREKDPKFFFQHFYANVVGSRPTTPPEVKKDEAPKLQPDMDYVPPPPSLAPVSN